MDEQADHPSIVAIGASAGGVSAISNLLSRLPSDLNASVMIVLHRPADRASYLQGLLERATALRVRLAYQNEVLKPGTCCVAPPDRHLALRSDGRINLLPDGFYRGQDIDALFTSLAHRAGGRTIGVVLSGVLGDGTVGLKAIKAIKDAAGVALVQSPSEAEFPQMPQNAIAYDGAVDLIAPVDLLASEIAWRVGRSLVQATASP